MISEYAFSKALDAVGTKIKKHYDDKQLEKAINDSLDRLFERFERFSHNEAYNWYGLKTYITNNQFTLIPSVFLSPESDVRKETENRIFSEAYRHAKADTTRKQRRVGEVIQHVLTVVGNFLYGNQEIASLYDIRPLAKSKQL